MRQGRQLAKLRPTEIENGLSGSAHALRGLGSEVSLVDIAQYLLPHVFGALQGPLRCQARGAHKVARPPEVGDQLGERDPAGHAGGDTGSGDRARSDGAIAIRFDRGQVRRQLRKVGRPGLLHALAQGLGSQSFSSQARLILERARLRIGQRKRASAFAASPDGRGQTIIPRNPKSKTSATSSVFPVGAMSHFQDGGLLHFNHSVGYQKKEFGHNPIDDFSLVDKLQPDRKVLTLATRRALGVQAMVIAETRLGTEDGGPGNPSLIKKARMSLWRNSRLELTSAFR